jgi:hypothetical protein
MARKIWNSIFTGFALFLAGWFFNYVGTQGYTSAMPLFQKLGIFTFLFTDIFYISKFDIAFSLGDVLLLASPIITIILLIRGYIYEKNNSF